MDAFAPHNGEEYANETLSGFDFVAIEDVLVQGLVREHVKGLPEGAAKSLFLETDDIMHHEDGEKLLRESVEALSHEEKALYAKFLTIQNSAKSASNIIAASNAMQMPGENQHDLDDMIAKMKADGVSGHELAGVLNGITQWKTGTPHPTQHLSEEGKQLFRVLLQTSEQMPENRVAHAREAIKSMFDTNITRKAKMTVREETEADRKQAKLRRQALRGIYKNLNTSLQKHYGKDAPDLLDSSVRLELAYHTWCGAGDTDGKSNADKIALMEGLVGYTIDAVEEHLDDINRAIEASPELADRLENTKQSLKTVYDRLQVLESKLIDPDHNDFEVLKTAYESLYKGLNVGYAADNNSVNTEQEMYEKLTLELRDLSKNVSSEAQTILSESLFVARQYKDTITTAKIETRANGFVDQDIMNKLFGDHEFQRQYLSGAMRRELANRAFTTLPKEKQRAIMKDAAQAIKKDRVAFQENYNRIFPAGLDDKGFPNQLRERGERMQIQSITPEKFGMSIIADAQELSPEYARFLGEVGFGVTPMMHTMLTEDYDTLNHAADITIDFTKNGGLDSVFAAVAKNKRLGDYLERYGVMLPCSDSIKKLGPAAVYLQAQAINHLMKYAVENNVVICVKWGNGQAITRGAGSHHAPGRLKEQALQWWLNNLRNHNGEGEQVLDLSKPEDLKLLQNVMFASNTTQGRAPDFVGYSVNKVVKDTSNMIGEMLGRVRRLTGKDDGQALDIQEYKHGVRKNILDPIARNVMMRGYENFRDVFFYADENDKEGRRLSDTVATEVSNMGVAGDANQAARPDSKEALQPQEAKSESAQQAKKVGKPLYDLRAIGTTIAITHMRSHHDGWFSIGAGMQALHQAHIDNEIDVEDMAKFPKDALWENIIKTGLRTATMSDVGHVLRKLGAGEWSHEKAMRVGKSVQVHPAADSNEPPQFSFDGAKEGITAEQAYAAKLYYDQALFVTYTEKLAALNLTGEPMLQTLEEVEQVSLLHLQGSENKVGRFQLGLQTRVLYPFVDQDLNGNRKKSLPAQIVADVVEECRDEMTKEQLFAVTGAQRSTSAWNNSDLYQDIDALGSNPSLALIKMKLEHVRSCDVDTGLGVGEAQTEILSADI